MPLPETKLISRLRKIVGPNRVPAGGIGDDCAVLELPRGHQALITTDFSLEKVHFRREWHPPDSIGHRCLARGLSDVAAMGGEPHAAFLSLALPSDLPQGWVDQFFSGFLKLARRFSVLLVGGDTAESPAGVLADIIVLGSAPRGKAILRSGAHVGDFIYVTGVLGISAFTLQQLQAGRRLRPKQHTRHFYPEPRIEVGRYLREKRLVSAMIDISDGLSTDLHHLCEESGVGAVIYSESLPRMPGPQSLEFALHGGEDYELLFTAPPRERVPAEIGGVPVTRIGEITPGKSIRIASADGSTKVLRARGWEHLRWNRRF